MADEYPPQVPVTPLRHAKFSLKPEPKTQKPSEPTTSKRRGGAESIETGEKKFSDLKDPEQWEELVGAFRQHRRRLLSIPGVTAVDVGYKIVGQKFTDNLALRVHVERKLPDEARKNFEERPYDFIWKNGTNEIPPERQFRGPKGYAVPMDVIQAEYRPTQLSELPRQRMALEKPKGRGDVNRRRRLDPLVGGISIGSPQTPVGTLGALVWDNTDGSVCILSNWHVLSGDLHAEIGNPCFQPGRFDQGKSSDVVAGLKRWSFDNQSDAAIAELCGSRHYCAGEIISIPRQISDATDPFLGMRVRKSGRSTGATWGFVDGLYFSAAIEYGKGIVQIFEDQIHIAPLAEDPSKPLPRISEPGDSGSVWVTDDLDGEGCLAVGLHFAGDLPRSAFGEYALANPMNIVMDRLNFSFRPLFLEIRDEHLLSQPLQPQQRGVGIQHVGLFVGGLTGSGSQPVSNTLDPGGKS
jgi:hypothetical protein